MEQCSDVILTSIFAHGSPDDLGRWQRCCRRWNQIISDDYIWRVAFSAKWNNLTPASRLNEKSWKLELIARAFKIRAWSCRLPNSLSALKLSCPNPPQDVFLDTLKHSIQMLYSSTLLNAQIGSSSGSGKSARLSQRWQLYLRDLDRFELSFGKFFLNPSSPASSLALGFENGKVCYFPTTPAKSLAETFHFALDSCSSNDSDSLSGPVISINQINSQSLLVVQSRRSNDWGNGVDSGDFYFHIWTMNKSSGARLLRRFELYHISAWCYCSKADKLVYINRRNELVVLDLFQDARQTNDTCIDSLDQIERRGPVLELARVSCPCQLKPKNQNNDLKILHLPSTDWIIIYGVPESDSQEANTLDNSLYFVNLNSVLTTCVVNISGISSISNVFACNFNVKDPAVIADGNAFDLIVLATADGTLAATELLHLHVDLEARVLQFQQNPLQLPNFRGSILDVHITPSVSIVLGSEAVWVMDSLSWRCINQRKIPRTCQNQLSGAEGRGKILQIVGEVVVVKWAGGRAIHIWNFGGDESNDGASNRSNALFYEKPVNNTTRAADSQKASVQETRLGLREWEEDRVEEERIDGLRDHFNISGLTEKEMISYAKMMSTGSDQCADEQQSDWNEEDDSELLLALRLSLTEK